MAKNSSQDKSKSLKTLEISAKAIIDNIVFSKTDKMAYYKVSNEVFDFLSSSQQVQLGLRVTSALNDLMSSRREPLPCHMIITSVPVDVDSWSGQVKEISRSWGTPAGFDRYIEEQIRYLKYEQFHRKVTYLGVSLGKRGAIDSSDTNIFEAGIKGAWDTIKQAAATTLKQPTDSITASEEEKARQQEEAVYRSLSKGNLQATRCTAEEILLLIKRQFYPAMRTPYLEIEHGDRIGPGDIALEIHKSVSKTWRMLKFNQLQEDGSEQEGFRACVTFANFAKFQGFPSAAIPFFYLPQRVGLPFTCYSRFDLYPSEKIKTELEKKKQEHKDEIENLSVGKTAIDSTIEPLPADVMDSLDDIQTISGIIAQDKSPWVQGHYRIVIEGTTEAQVKDFFSFLKQRYADMDINLSWSSGNQAGLFLEQMPGDKVRFDAFQQTTNLTSLATSGFNFSSDIGDPIFGSEGNI